MTYVERPTQKNYMLRTFLSPLLVVVSIILIPSIEKALSFLPLIFSLSISLVNFKRLKINNKLFGIVLSVLQSYTVFIGLAIVLFFFDEFLQDVTIVNQENSAFKGIILVTLGGYFAALLLFYFFSFLFRIDNKRFSYLIITICYGIVVLVMQVFSKNEFLQFGVEKFASFLISWIIFMSLSFSLSMNRNNFMRTIENR